MPKVIFYRHSRSIETNYARGPETGQQAYSSATFTTGLLIDATIVVLLNIKYDGER